MNINMKSTSEMSNCDDEDVGVNMYIERNKLVFE